MVSLESFMNMNINLKEFEDIYNNFTDKKISFGGGNVTVDQLISEVTFVEEQYKNGGVNLNEDLMNHVNDLNYQDEKKKGGKRMMKKSKKGGGENLATSTAKAGDTQNSGDASNFFYVTKPSQEFTNVTNLVDMVKNTFEYPEVQSMQRSFVF